MSVGGPAVSREEFERRRAANAAGGPRTFVCRCGHSWSTHPIYRDPTPSSPNFYLYGACSVDGCACHAFLSEYDAAAVE